MANAMWTVQMVSYRVVRFFCKMRERGDLVLVQDWPLLRPTEEGLVTCPLLHGGTVSLLLHPSGVGSSCILLRENGSLLSN